MLSFSSLVLLSFFVAFAKELFFLNEELVLFFSFIGTFLVLLDLVARFAFQYFDDQTGEIFTRFYNLLDKKIIVVTHFLNFRSLQVSTVALLKQVFLLVLNELPSLAKFPLFVIYTFYSQLFSFLLTMQFRLVNQSLKHSLLLIGSFFKQTPAAGKKKAVEERFFAFGFVKKVSIPLISQMKRGLGIIKKGVSLRALRDFVSSRRRRRR